MSDSTNHLALENLFMATLLSNQTLNKHYQTNQQVKYLHLEAEIDMLLQKINALTQRKQSETSQISSDSD